MKDHREHRDAAGEGLTTHPEILEELCEKLGEELDSPSCRGLRAHLETCPGCRAYVSSLMKTVALYRRAETPPAPGDLKGRLFQALHLPGDAAGRHG